MKERSLYVIEDMHVMHYSGHVRRPEALYGLVGAAFGRCTGRIQDCHQLIDTARNPRTVSTLSGAIVSRPFTATRRSPSSNGPRLRQANKAGAWDRPSRGQCRLPSWAPYGLTENTKALVPKYYEPRTPRRLYRYQPNNLYLRHILIHISHAQNMHTAEADQPTLNKRSSSVYPVLKAAQPNRFIALEATVNIEERDLIRRREGGRLDGILCRLRSGLFGHLSSARCH